MEKMKVNPYIVTNGNGREAVEFYQKVFDAEVIGIQSFGQMPASPDMPMPEEAKNLIAHALFKIGETEIMLSDNFPGNSYQLGDQLNLCIMADDKEQAKKYYDALQDGGKVDMPLQETFWSPAYGIVTDKFGVTFQISTQGQPQQ